jgi:hypothetical protein
LWTSGGDSRVSLDAASGLNKYGCSAVPRRSSVAFSSCTASCPSEVGYRAAENTRQRLLGSAMGDATLLTAFASAVEDTRQGLAMAIGLDRADGAEVVLAASGTDCEFYALQLALQRHAGNVVAIVVGPDETGSGSLAAASGRHFDHVAPLVRPVSPGRPLDGLDVDRLRVESLPVRDGAGMPIPIREIDAAVGNVARAAIREGAHVLLHVVDSSKTGLRAPGIGAVRRLQQELKGALTVVVDAAQMRTRPETVVEYVRDGWLVMISGSKFFTGPPFSGALLVPRELARDAAKATTVAAGFAAYLSAFDVPPAWNGWRASAGPAPNFGLLLRWRAALAEMHAFNAIDVSVRNKRLRDLCRRIHFELRSRRCLEIVAAPVGDRDGTGHGWDVCRTIWTFVLKREAAAQGLRKTLDYDEAWQVYVWLNRNLSAMLPSQATAAERALAATSCHIGQPVRIRCSDGGVAGGLRLALGARSLTAVAHDAGCVLDKIEVILKYWSQLTAQRAVA